MCVDVNGNLGRVRTGSNGAELQSTDGHAGLIPEHVSACATSDSGSDVHCKRKWPQPFAWLAGWLTVTSLRAGTVSVLFAEVPPASRKAAGTQQVTMSKRGRND